VGLGDLDRRATKLLEPKLFRPALVAVVGLNALLEFKKASNKHRQAVVILVVQDRAIVVQYSRIYCTLVEENRYSEYIGSLLERISCVSFN
jgi:hypothetical protein